MDSTEIEKILAAHSTGELETEQATKKIQNLSYENLGFARVDHSRSKRQGFPEVIFGLGKTDDQILAIFERLVVNAQNVLITHANKKLFGEIRNVTTDAEWHPEARIIRLIRETQNLGQGRIAVVTAGTSDIPVGEEAALTAETMGNEVVRVWDAGVAGLRRILDQREVLEEARVIVCAAGMEGALPSVVGGLVSVPVIAVPTSIGYGASFEGLAAMLGMINSCSSNVTVVNIDNGFGAGFVASLINRKWENKS